MFIAAFLWCEMGWESHYSYISWPVWFCDCAVHNWNIKLRCMLSLPQSKCKWSPQSLVRSEALGSFIRHQTLFHSGRYGFVSHSPSQFKKKKSKCPPAGDVVILWTVHCASSWFYYKIICTIKEKNTQNNHFFQWQGENHKFCSITPLLIYLFKIHHILWGNWMSKFLLCKQPHMMTSHHVQKQTRDHWAWKWPHQWITEQHTAWILYPLVVSLWLQASHAQSSS